MYICEKKGILISKHEMFGVYFIVLILDCYLEIGAQVSIEI